MSAIHIILDTTNREWRKPPIKGVYLASIDVGDLDYDHAKIASIAQQLITVLYEAAESVDG